MSIPKRPPRATPDPMNDAETVDYLPIVTDAATARPSALSAGVRIDLGARSHPGKVRPNNEDHFLAVQFGRSLVRLQTNVPGDLVPARFAEMGYGFAVADGLGGEVAGEVASSLAIGAGLNLALNTPKWTLQMTPDEIRENMETWRLRFRQIDYVLTERAVADPSLAGMGTTLTVACSVGNDLMLYHIGDSRAYLFRAGQLYQLTNDHTVAQQLADAGLIGAADVARHRLRHLLTRALGRGGGDIEAELQHLGLADGDRLLLCSDGLTDMLTDERIADVLRQTEASEPASEALLDLALEAGGRDNVTVVLARYTIPALPPTAETTLSA